jgi:hypothetical protein
MENSLREMLEKPLANLPTFIDIGRLSRRIDVFIIEEAQAEEAQVVDSPRDTIVETNEKSHAHSLSRVVKKVMMHLEPVEQHERLLQALDEFVVKSGDSLDLQNHVRELFHSFDDNCRTVRIFKMINQAALSLAVTALKVGVASQPSSIPPEGRMTKDVRTPDGWRISIILGQNEICISHIRKEQTLGPPFSPDHWEVKWKLDMHFSSSMRKLEYANISIVKMMFGPNIPPAMKTELERLYKSFDVHASHETVTSVPRVQQPAEERHAWYYCNIM